MTAIATPVSALPTLRGAPIPLSNAKAVSSPSLTSSSADSVNAGDDDSIASNKARVSAFVRKLRSMVDDESVQHIHWTPDGEAFRVVDSNAFSRVLSNYFKHNNWQSFIRQLNIYGFVKLSEQPGQPAGLGLPSPTTPQLEWTFKHPLFLRHAPDLMEEIKRRTPKPSKSMGTDDNACASTNKKAKVIAPRIGSKDPLSLSSNKTATLPGGNDTATQRTRPALPTSVATAPPASHPLFPPGIPFPGALNMPNNMAAAAAAAKAAMVATGMNPATAAAMLSAHGHQGHPPLHTPLPVNPNSNLPPQSTPAVNRNIHPLQAPFPAGLMALPRPNVVGTNQSTSSVTPTTSLPRFLPQSQPPSKPKRSTASSVSSTSSGTTLAETAPSNSSEADRLRSQMSVLQTRLDALRSHLQTMDGVSSRAMSQVMQVLATPARNDCPLSTVTELQDCLESWRSMSDMANTFLSLEGCQKAVEEGEDGSDDGSVSSEWGPGQSHRLFMDTEVEPTMLLLDGPSLIDAPVMNTVDDFGLSFDDATSLHDYNAERPFKRRKTQ